MVLVERVSKIRFGLLYNLIVQPSVSSSFLPCSTSLRTLACILIIYQILQLQISGGSILTSITGSSNAERKQHMLWHGVFLWMHLSPWVMWRPMWNTLSPPMRLGSLFIGAEIEVQPLRTARTVECELRAGE
jgi:hypothetical protein